MASSNRSWLSSSSVGSREQDDDCHSFEDHSQQNTSINSNNSIGRTRSRGDRYNHYRRDAPAKVKPWMRDKAITGTPGSRPQGRFGGSVRMAVRSQIGLAEATSVGSNSCANSVSSNSSFMDAPSRPLPSEVAADAPISGRSLQYDDDSVVPPEEDRQEEHFDNEESTAGEIQYSGKDTSEDAKEEIDAADTQINTLGNSTPEPNTQQQNTNDNTTETPDDETEKNNALSPPLDDDALDKNTITNEEIPCTTTMPPAPKIEENSSLAGEEKSDKDNALLGSPDVVDNPPTNPKDDGGEQQEVESADEDVDKDGLPEENDMVIVNKYAYQRECTVEVQGEFYDELPSVRPSSYNPMSSAKITTEKSVAVYANLEKPTPLVTAQAALLNDAIAEEMSEEETSVEDEESNVNNISADTLQGIKALDATRDESFVETNDFDFEFSRMELDREPVVDEFHKMWPHFVEPKDIPEIIFPADWEQRQTLAAGETQTWIQNQLQQKLQGFDFKSGAYSDFAAALSDCPPLTLGFLADNDDNNVSNEIACYCFCPCSNLMAPWRNDKLASTEVVLYQDVIACDDQQYTPDALAEHCRATMSMSADPECRFLHGMVHKYLESLFGQSHAAFNAPVSGPNVAAAATMVSECISNEISTADPEEIENLKQSNAELLEKVKLAEETNDILEAKSMEAAATSVEYEERLNEFQKQLQNLQNSNGELVEQLKEAEETKMELARKNFEAASSAAEHEDQIAGLRADLESLETENKQLQDSLKAAEEKESLREAQSIETAGSFSKLAEKLKALQEQVSKLETEKSELQEKLVDAESKAEELGAKKNRLVEGLTEQATQLDIFSADKRRLEEANKQLTEKLRLAEEKHSNAVASSEAQAEMMNGLCEEMRQIEEAKEELQKKLEETEGKAKDIEEKHSAASTSNIDAAASIKKLEAEKATLEQTNTALSKKLAAAEDREREQAIREAQSTLVHVGDMPVDLRRFHVQCQKYFDTLRASQLKNHCIRDKSSVKVVVEYDPDSRYSIDLQKILDKGAAVESQDETYLFRALDTFNKGHFHTHKLLLPWKIVSTTGAPVPRSEFFRQAWLQLGNLKIKVGDKQTEIPLFQESLGHLIPTPNAMMEGMLRVSPDELERIFAAKIAPYYRAIGRLMIQCIGATAGDDTEYNLKISNSVMPYILRNKLFRGVDPTDESYLLEQLLDHAFSLLGINDMSRDKAFEYFSIEAKDYNDTRSAVKQIRKEVYEMWIKERSLALTALEEGLTLNGLADMSFCCGLVPLEAVNEIIFTR